MLIDWFTVFAQAINFLILVWLLKRYLYLPILNAIDAREKLIAAELADAAEQKKEAQVEHDKFQRMNDKYDLQASVLMQQAKEAAESERERLVGDIHQSTEAMRTQQQRKLASDAQNLKQALKEKVSQEVFAIARKTLGDLAATSLEDAIVNMFLQRLKTLDPETKATLIAALDAGPEAGLDADKTKTVKIRTAFDVSEQQQQMLQSVLNELFSLDTARQAPSLKITTSPDLISGIELSVNGQKLAWSIGEYLTTLEEGVDALVNKSA